MAANNPPAKVEAVDVQPDVGTVTDSTATKIQADAVPAAGTRLDTAAPATVPDGSTFTFTPDTGPPIIGNVSRVDNRNILTSREGDTYEVTQQGEDKRTVLTRVEKDTTTGKFTDVKGPNGRPEMLTVARDGVTISNPTIGTEKVRYISPSGAVEVDTGRKGPKGDTTLQLSNSEVPPLEVVAAPKKFNLTVSNSPDALVGANPDIKVRVSSLPDSVVRDLDLRGKGKVPLSSLPENIQNQYTDLIKAGTLKVNDHGVVSGPPLAIASHLATENFRPVIKSVPDASALPTGDVPGKRFVPTELAANPKQDFSWKGAGVPPVFKSPEFANFRSGHPDLSYKALRAAYAAEHPELTGFNPKAFGDNGPGWPQRRFGEGDNYVMRDPNKIPGFDIGGGDKMHRNMVEFWKGIQGMKPGDNLNGVLDLMNGRMNGKDIARLGDFLLGQLGRKGTDALGMQDIMKLSTLFKGFGDRAGLSMQFGDSRSSLMLSFGLNGKFDFQIRFGALTLGFGDRSQTGLQQIGKLLFTTDGRQTQAALGTGGLRATDILSRSFTGQSLNQGQWNPFGSNTGDGALRASTQLTAKLTAGNRDFISQLQDNSAKLAQQLDASKLAQMGKLPGLVQGDFKPGRALDPGAKGQIQQNLDPQRQDIGKLQQGQKADGGKILMGNIEMDARTADGMAGRRGPLTAAAHEATMKGDLQNQQAKGDQLPGAKVPTEKLTAEEEAAKKKIEEEKKKGDVRAGEQFTQEEEERKAKERREQEEEDREEELEAQNEADEAKRRALLLILEARKKREKELKEKALKDQIQKQEEAKRTQYRVAIGDSLENIATKQLRNPRLAGLIFDVNKKLIPIKFMNGKEVAVLKVGAILSLPSVKEIKDFSQAGFTLGPKFNKVDFTLPAVSEQGKTAEDELEAMFGSNWHGGDAETAESETPQNTKSQEEMDEFAKRRANIESVLGKMGPKRAADGRMRYTVRLGDTLKSIAMKHPALEDVSSWRVLAEINNLSIETDAKDNPKALVPRGSVLMIPTKEEVEEHKRKMGLRKAILAPGQSVTTGSALPALKHCPNCGNKSIHTATICECGTEFVSYSEGAATTGANAATPHIVNDSKSNQDTDQKLEQSLSQVSTNSFMSGQSIKKEDRFELAAKSGHIDGDHWSEIANLEPETRIVKLNSVFDPNLEFSLLLLQALVEGRWLPVAGYEMREDAAVRIDYTDPKSRSSVRIDLPPSAAQDLAKNDLIKNWQNYKRKFVTILPQQGSAKIND